MNYLVFSSIINFITSILLATFLSVSKSKIKSFIYLNITISLWAVSYLFWQLSNSADVILFFCKILTFFSVFMPIFFFKFSLELHSLRTKHKNLTILFYLFTVVFAILSFSDYMVKGIYKTQFGNYWPQAGNLYFFFVLYFSLVFGYSFFILLKNNRNNREYYLLFFSSVFGFVGGASNFLLWFGINVFPFGNVLLAASIFFIAVAIINYGLFDLGFQLSSLGSYLFLSVFIFFSVSPTLMMHSAILKHLYIFLVLFLWALFGERFRKKMQIRAERTLILNWYDPLEFTATISEKLIPILETESYFQVLKKELKNKLRIRNIVVFCAIKDPLDNKKVRHYKTIFNRKSGKPKTINLDSAIIKFLKQNKDAVDCLNFPDVVLKKFKLLKLNIDPDGTCLPIHSESGLEGFILLGSKDKRIPYSRQDKKLLNWLIRQAKPIWSRIEPHEVVKYEGMKSMEIAKEAAAYKNLADMSKQIAHEINNPMAVIKTAAQIALRKLKGDSMDVELIERKLKKIEKEAQSVSETAQAIMHYNFTESEHKGAFQVNAILKELMEFPVASTVHVVLDVDEALPEVLGDEVRLNMVFLNIFKNASDAMRGAGGTITIRSEKTDAGARLSIIDEGPGMPPEVLKRLYDPFFTTKADGHGLGLITVKQIVEDHQGVIDIQSEVGVGTTVSVVLPFSDG